MSNKQKIALNIVISGGILFALAQRVEMDQVQKIWAKGHHHYLFLVVLFFLPQFIISGRRWRILMNKAFELSISQVEAIGQVLASYTLNLLVPGKVGELIRLVWMNQNENYSHGKGVYLLLVEKYFDVAILILLSTIGMFLAQKYSGSLIFLFVFLGSLFSFYKMNFLIDKFSILKERLKFLRDFQDVAPKIRHAPQAWLWSLLLWIIQVFQMTLIVFAFTENIPIDELIFGLPLVVLSGVVPLTFMGIGARESAFVFLYQKWVSEDVLVTIALLLTLRVIITNVVGLPFLFKLQGKKHATN